MKHKGLCSCSQETATGLYPELNVSTPYCHIKFNTGPIITSFSSSDLLPLGLPTKILFSFSFPLRITCPPADYP
jgi:hypothetical protein